MKIKFFGGWCLGTAVAVFCLAGKICLAQPQPDATDAAISPPPGILPSSPLAEVVRLVQAGVDESVILTYVTNSISTFNLDSGKIIYLANLGVPNEITTAMMQRDQVLQQQMTAASSLPQPAPAPDATGTTTDTPPPEPAVVTVNYFQTTLAPYGNWVDIEGYGRCWRPTTVVYDPNWQPYCNRGHWVYSDCGWYWVSDYAWGATFHYGRWFRDTRFGWCWWPDTTWAPSWVTWRYTDDYCGWAPLPPFAVYRPGIGFVYRGNGISVGFDFGLNIGCFTFVPTRNFCDPHPQRYRCALAEVTRIYNHTTVINNINFNDHRIINNGITVQHIADVTRTQIRPIPVRELRTQNNQGLRGGTFDRQNRQPRVSTAGSAKTPSSAFGNGNNTGQRVQDPAQNHFSQPVINGNPQPVQNPSTPVQSPARNPDNDKRIESPRAQQLEPLPPRPVTQTPQSRDFLTPLPPPANRSAPVDRSYNPPPQISVEQPQLRDDLRPNNPAPQERPVPSAQPAPSAPARASQSQSSDKSDKRNQN
jgi:hypothetical protein